MRRIALLFLAIALLYTGAGFLPGRTFAPLDLPLDAGAWKSDPTQRIRVSNSLLGDVIVQFVPWDREVLRMLGRGEIPWVNRFAGDGAPLFANPQTALFSPFTWPRLMLGLDGWAFMALLKILAALLCAYWFARELDVARHAAILSAIVYATAGYTIVWLLYPITHVFVLLPGLAAAALRLMKFPSIRHAAYVILFAALCSAGGHPETLFIGVLGIWIFLAWEAEKRAEWKIGALVPSSVGALLGFLLLAFQLVPFLTILGDSYASVLRPQTPHPFRIWGIASQLLPGMLGTPLRGELDLTALPMAENFNLRAGGYIGAIVLLALILAFRELPGTLKRALFLGTVALVISWVPPGLWNVAKHIPVVRVLTLEYFVALFVLFGAMAAGPAIVIVAARKRRKIGTALVLAGALALLAGVLPLVPFARPLLTSVARSGIEQLRTRGHLQQAPEVYEQRLAYYLDAAGLTTLRRLAIPGACWLLAGLALVLTLQRRALLLSVAAAGELFAFGIGFNPAVAMTDVPPPPEAVRVIRERDPRGDFLIAEHFEVFPANLGTLYGIRDASSYDAMNTRGTVERLLPGGYDPALHTFNPILSPQQEQYLAANGVRFVIGPKGLRELPNAVPVPLPPNHRPTGVIAGIVISLLALVASATWLRLYLLDPVRDATPLRP